MSFTKTETALMNRARKNSAKRVCVQFGHKGKATFGTREINAANSLVKKGVFARVTSSNAASCKWGGVAEYSSEVVFTLTEAN
jgi:hypothetical protein